MSRMPPVNSVSGCKTKPHSNLDISFYILSVDLLENENEPNYKQSMGASSANGQPQNSTSRITPGRGDATDGSNEPNLQGSWVRPDLTRTSLNTNHVQPQSVRLPPISALASDRPTDLRSIVQDGHRPWTQNVPRAAPGTFTRNLVGSLVASAYKLKDTNDELGIWFVLQDLSVRTEGSKSCSCRSYGD